MTKKELRRMIRQEVRKEVEGIIPDLVKEVLIEVTKDVKKMLLKESRRTENKSVKKPESEIAFDPERIRKLIGYENFAPESDDYTNIPEYLTESRKAPTIAGVPVMEGLKAKEDAASQGLSFNEMPKELRSAIAKSKQVFDNAEKRANYRPGVK